jgi:hypothetical protein
MKPSGRAWAGMVAVAIVATAVLTAPGRALAQQFFASLRLAKPQPVSVNVPSFSGPNAARQLQDAVNGMLSEQVTVTLEEKDQPATDASAASKLAGFATRLPAARRDPPTLIVMGAHGVAMTVNRSQLSTILREAGRPDVQLPQALDGAAMSVRSPRSVRAQYGNCPAPPAPTLANQIQGPPPPSTDNGNCVVLTESPAAQVEAPSSLDLEQLVEIGLELAGMSPNQTQAFQRTVGSKSTLVLSMPRAIRSFDLVDVNGRPAMLMNTASRRGPTCALIWTRGDLVYSLVGYGSAADALMLARSIN